MGELMLALTGYLIFYNEGHFHQTLDNGTPSDVYKMGIRRGISNTKVNGNRSNAARLHMKKSAA